MSAMHLKADVGDDSGTFGFRCACYESTPWGLRLPAHPVDRPARDRVDVVAGMHEAVLCVKADGAGIVLVDEKIESGR